MIFRKADSEQITKITIPTFKAWWFLKDPIPLAAKYKSLKYGTKIAEVSTISSLTNAIDTEEQGLVNDKSKNKYWIIDALDGTVNYINKNPFFCV